MKFNKVRCRICGEVYNHSEIKEPKPEDPVQVKVNPCPNCHRYSYDYLLTPEELSMLERGTFCEFCGYEIKPKAWQCPECLTRGIIDAFEDNGIKEDWGKRPIDQTIRMVIRKFKKEE